MVYREMGEHLCQYRFSIWGYTWSSFVSILSVSWSILVEVLEDIEIVRGGVGRRWGEVEVGVGVVVRRIGGRLGGIG